MGSTLDRANPLTIPSGLSENTAAVLEAMITVWGTDRPTLRQMWAAMDLAWDNFGLNNHNPDPDGLAAFYSHPVWLLNGIFIEHHSESMKHRETFSDWIAEQCPARVADLGGGYGTLARMIAGKCPEATVHVIEPYPAAPAIAASKDHANLSYEADLDSEYDVLIATDVFEHLVDPLAVLFEVAPHVRVGGYMIPANHFAPSIKCHLPKTFHFNATWPLFMALAGFEPVGPVAYAEAFRKVRHRTMTNSVRDWERRSRQAWRIGRRSHRAARSIRKGVRFMSRRLL